MKTLIWINGPNGVGKSTTSRLLFQTMPNSCWLESEWCRSINPFDLTPEVELLTAANMSMLIRNYFECSLVDYVILNYGLHGPRRRIFDRVLNGLEDVSFDLLPITLMCSQEENTCRMIKDGRDAERITRALEQTRPLYQELGYPIVDTTHLTPDEAVDEILAVVRSHSVTLQGRSK